MVIFLIFLYIYCVIGEFECKSVRELLNGGKNE